MKRPSKGFRMQISCSALTNDNVGTLLVTARRDSDPRTVPALTFLLWLNLSPQTLQRLPWTCVYFSAGLLRVPRRSIGGCFDARTCRSAIAGDQASLRGAQHLCCSQTIPHGQDSHSASLGESWALAVLYWRSSVLVQQANARRTRVYRFCLTHSNCAHLHAKRKIFSSRSAFIASLLAMRHRHPVDVPHRRLLV